MNKGSFRATRCGVLGVEAMAADTTHAFGRHTHDQYGIGLILRGGQKSLSGRGVVEAMAGDVISVNPGEVHDGTPLDAHGRAWRMLYFDPVVLADAMADLTGGSARCAELTRPAMRDAAAARRFCALFRAAIDPRGGHSEIEAREGLLLLLVGLMEPGHEERARAAPSGIERARARIDDDPSTPLSIPELARLGGVSQFQLIRGFSKLTGLTPHAYLVQRRLQKARKQIAAGVTLADAACEAGFADQSHMTRLFTRTYGISPGLYAAAMN